MMPEENSPSEEDAQDQTSNEHSDNVSDSSSSEEDTTDVDTLKAELAAKEEENDKLQTKLRDKGRKLKEAETSKEDSPDYVTQEDLWERDNKDALELYSDRIEELVTDGIEGETVTRKVALSMAIAESGATSGNSVENARQDDMSVPSSTKRSFEKSVQLTEDDATVGLTLERKKELVERFG